MELEEITISEPQNAKHIVDTATEESFTVAELTVDPDHAVAPKETTDENELKLKRSQIEEATLDSDQQNAESQGLTYSERVDFSGTFLLANEEGIYSFKETDLPERIRDNLYSSKIFDAELITRDVFVYTPERPLFFIETITPYADPYNYIYGTNLGDILNGTSGMDKIYLLDGDDTVNHSAGADMIYGGLGRNTYSFSGENGNFTVNLVTNTVQVGGVTSHIYDFQDVTGGNGNDTITGNALDNIISAGAGDDYVYGSAGNDTLNGGAGTNTLDYSAQTSDLNVNLSTNTATGADIGTDTISNFTIIRLGSGNDNVTGSGLADTFYDGGGNDTIRGGNGDDIFYAGAGNDALYGEGGEDWIYFSHVSADVTVNLATGNASSAETGTDTLSSFSRAVTGSGNDTVIGCSCDNIIRTGAGNDTIDGGGGNDDIYGGSGADTLTGGTGADRFIFLATDGLDTFDTITDFNVGQNDKIDISDVLTGYDPITDVIHDFVSFVAVGADLNIYVDLDGAGADHNSALLAIVTGGSALDLDTLIASNNFIV